VEVDVHCLQVLQGTDGVGSDWCDGGVADVAFEGVASQAEVHV
jgi:hypothetical protein